MREERLKILNMLQEGKITAEEAERLIAALSAGGAGPKEENEEPGGHGRRPHHGFWDFDFDFRPFEHQFRRFGPIFDEGFRRKFQDKARSFRAKMRWADEDAQREAKEAMRRAAEAVNDALHNSNIKETVESIGKTVMDAMEDLMRRFSGDRPADSDKKDETGKPRGEGPTQTV